MIAIIGAGVAGSAAARVLTGSGQPVALFDKGRGPGGRAACRRGLFDHGAQFFTARDPRFQKVVQQLAQQQWVAPWECRSGVLGAQGFHPLRPEVARWVGTPGMSQLVEGLQSGLKVHFEHTVTGLERESQAWYLQLGERRVGPFQALLLTAPAPQAQSLLRPVAPPLADSLGAVEYDPCLAAMVELKSPAGLDFDAATVAEDGAGAGLGFVTRNTSKPHRQTQPERWILHSSVAFAREHLEAPPEQWAPTLWQQFCERTGLSAELAQEFKGHRWRYARVSKTLGQPYLWDPELQLGWAGDGALGPRLEAAFLSGLQLAEALAGRAD